MSTQNKCCAIILVILVWTASAQRQSRATSLRAAIARDQVRAEFQALGGSSGDTIQVTLVKTANAPSGALVLEVEPGSILRSPSVAHQSMAVVAVRGKSLGGREFLPASRIVLEGQTPASYILSAYCAEFTKDNPPPSMRFALQPADSTIACIARRGRHLSVAAMQAAVWQRTDHVDFAAVAEKFPVRRMEWDQALAVYRSCR